MSDKTSFTQGLMHLIKGNLGTGVLAMPASFSHAGLVNSIIGLPILCLVALYCVHLIIKTSQVVESKAKDASIDYARLSKFAFQSGPGWMRQNSDRMCLFVDTILLTAQLGVCCVYLVFIVDNLTKVSLESIR